MRTIKLTSDEQNELAAIYARLDAEWRIAGTPTTPERMPFDRDGIIEHRKLTADERKKGLRAYAWAPDRIIATLIAAQKRAA